MTYEEFKEIIERTGEYQVSDGRGSTTISHQGIKVICYISKTRLFGINTIFSENEDFFKEYLDTIIEFAKTPIEDRYPVKKYYVKLEALRFIDDEKVYLNRYTSVFKTTQYDFDTKDSLYEGMIDCQTQFTMEEIEEIIPKEDMDKFKIIPVEEDK